jgi:hypothetical protein
MYASAANASHLVAPVRASTTFINGNLVERPDEHHHEIAAAVKGDVDGTPQGSHDGRAPVRGRVSH